MRLCTLNQMEYNSYLCLINGNEYFDAALYGRPCRFLFLLIRGSLKKFRILNVAPCFVPLTSIWIAPFTGSCDLSKTNGLSLVGIKALREFNKKENTLVAFYGIDNKECH